MCSDLDKTQITRDWLDKYRKIISSDSLGSIFEVGRFGTVGGCVYSGVVSYWTAIKRSWSAMGVGSTQLATNHSFGFLKKANSID